MVLLSSFYTHWSIIRPSAFSSSLLNRLSLVSHRDFLTFLILHGSFAYLTTYQGSFSLFSSRNCFQHSFFFPLTIDLIFSCSIFHFLTLPSWLIPSSAFPFLTLLVFFNWFESSLSHHLFDLLNILMFLSHRVLTVFIFLSGDDSSKSLYYLSSSSTESFSCKSSTILSSFFLCTTTLSSTFLVISTSHSP